MNSGCWPAALMPVILPVSVVAMARMNSGFLAWISLRKFSALGWLLAYWMSKVVFTVGLSAFGFRFGFECEFGDFESSPTVYG